MSRARSNDVHEARLLAAGGMSKAEIARRLGVAENTIYTWCRGDTYMQRLADSKWGKRREAIGDGIPLPHRDWIHAPMMLDLVCSVLCDLRGARWDTAT